MKTLPFSALFRGLSLLICLALLNGCGTVRLEVPAGHSVRLLEKDEYAAVRIERTIWFWLWGARPISDNTTSKDIKEHRLTEVRVLSEQNMTDNITILLTAWFTIVRRTLIVEGNTAADQKIDRITDSAGITP